MISCPKCDSDMVWMPALKSEQPGRTLSLQVLGLSPVPERLVCENWECGYEEEIICGNERKQ